MAINWKRFFLGKRLAADVAATLQADEEARFKRVRAYIAANEEMEVMGDVPQIVKDLDWGAIKAAREEKIQKMTAAFDGAFTKEDAERIEREYPPIVSERAPLESNVIHPDVAAGKWEKIKRLLNESNEPVFFRINPNDSTRTTTTLYQPANLPGKDPREKIAGLMINVEGSFISSGSDDFTRSMEMALNASPVFCEYFKSQNYRFVHEYDDDEGDIYDAHLEYRLENAPAPWWVRFYNWLISIFNPK